ncbi:F-box/FBD/LRR-repeat protein At5g53840-like isoform X2 [Humulus lupulus]|uniref:F-box/FBD/LRR-repeat protein At5g53840-like isoform X2 n=1 Tax=Humulus lupulus TaxID=3486 RepID=UPI002B41415D|nr:F-box/FBD/LRR-repeat protein At5g53840-like isoform X2 [Humulus lupulus]
MSKKRLLSNGHGHEIMADLDRLSNLPEVLIHHILSLVPAVDVVRMSFLSRRWKRMWYSIPILQFCNSDNRFRSPRAFEIFMHECLRRLLIGTRHNNTHHHHSIVTNYKFQIEYSNNHKAVLMRVMLSPIVWDNVMEFDLSVSVGMKKDCLGSFNLPYSIFSGRSLTVLKLKSDNVFYLEENCEFSPNLPRLKCLWLVHVFGLSDAVLDKLLLCCPLLEKLVLKSLELSNPYISSSSLKFLEINGYSHANLQVDATNLQSFEVRGALHDKIIIDITDFSLIRNLSINTTCDNIDDNFLENLISKLPLLEHLSLCHCYFLKHIKIRSQSLRSFSFGKAHLAEVKASMKTPNLVSFSYKGDLEFGMTIISPNDQLNGTFIISGTLPNDRLILSICMVHFLVNINCPWKILNLEAQSEQIVEFGMANS